MRCQLPLDLEVLEENEEVIEGFLICNHCKNLFPIILGVPVLWDDFSNYLSSRAELGGRLFLSAVNPKLKAFVKKSLKVNSFQKDRTRIEDRWVRIYEQSMKAKFYSVIRKNLIKFPRKDLALEHGCSIGIMSEFLANRYRRVFGIDKSFGGICIAKKNFRENLDYFVADSLKSPFGNKNFDLIIALNMLELVDSEPFLEELSNQIQHGVLLLTDPYDFDRVENRTKKVLDPFSLRSKLFELGFQIAKNTKKPSQITWNLKLNARAKLSYKVDLVIGKKTCHN